MGAEPDCYAYAVGPKSSEPDMVKAAGKRWSCRHTEDDPVKAEASGFSLVEQGLYFACNSETELDDILFALRKLPGVRDVKEVGMMHVTMDRVPETLN